ncbi:hypothetical protein OAN22_00795 [Alphaproteobacteria bacterium]|nr:hypothetical protein [Alphaproteobacteria bacterium]
MPQLDITTYISQFFWLTLCFAGLYTLLSKYVLPRAEKLTQQRWETTDGKQQEAATVHDKAQGVSDAVDQKLGKAREDAQDFIRKLLLAERNKVRLQHEDAVTQSEASIKKREIETEKAQQHELDNLGGKRDALGKALFQQITQDLLKATAKKNLR